MWRPGDLVRQRASIFRVDEVAGNPMIVVDVIYPPGDDHSLPSEIITMFNGRLYHWTMEGLESWSDNSR